MAQTKLPLVNANINSSQPYAVVTLPQQEMTKNATLEFNNQRQPILSQINLENTLTDVLMNDYTYVSFRAKPSIDLHGVGPFAIDFDKDVRILGLRQLQGMVLEQPRLLLLPEADGVNLLGYTMIPNPTILTLNTGNTSLVLRSGNIILGLTTVMDLVLIPGNHSYYTRTILDLRALIFNLPTLLVQQIDSLKQGYMAVNVTGVDNVSNGQHLPYFTYALSHLDAPVKIPFVDLLNNTIQPLLQEGIALIDGLDSVLHAIQTNDLVSLFAGGDLERFFSALGRLTSGSFLQ